jgi:hypothetical protein
MPAYEVTYEIYEGKDAARQVIFSVAEDEANALVDTQSVVDAYFPNAKCVPKEVAELINGTVVAYYQAMRFSPRIKPEFKSKIILTGDSDRVQ